MPDVMPDNDPYGLLAVQPSQVATPVQQDNDPYGLMASQNIVPHEQVSKHQQMINEDVQAMRGNSENPSSGVPATLLGYAANVEKAVPFMHEAGSALAALPSLANGTAAYGAKYNQLEQQQQALREAADQISPKIETPSFLPDITPSGVGQFGAGLALSGISPAPKTAATSLWGAAKQGAGYGAAYGAGTGDAFDTTTGSTLTRGKNALISGLLGVPLGALGGGIGYKIGQAATAAPELSPADKIIAHTMAKDNIGPETMAETVRTANQPLTIADVAGPSVQNLIEGIANTPGAALSNANDFLQNRNLQAKSQINDIIGRHISPLDYVEQRQATVNNLSNPEIKQAYTAAYNAVPSINDPQINQTLDRLRSTDVGRKAWQEATQAAILDGNTLGPLDADGVQRSMSTYGIDQFKRQLDSTIQGEAQAGNFDRMSPLGAKITELKNQLVGRTDEINPFFAQARAKYGDQASMINASDMGYQDLWSNRPGAASRTAQQYQNMSPTEKQAFLSGVARKIQEIGKTQTGDNILPNTANPAKNIINNPNVREKLSYILPSDKIDAFTNEMGLQGSMQDMSNKVLSGSQTARRLATQEDFANQTASTLEKMKPAMRYAANIDLMEPATWVGINHKNVEQFGKNMSEANRQKVGAEIMSKLLNPDRNASINMLNDLSKNQFEQLMAQHQLQQYLQAGNGMATTGLPRLMAPFSIAPQAQNQ